MIINKKILLTIVCFIFLSTFIPNTVSAKSVINLDQAVDMVVDNNLEIELALLELKKAEVQFRQAKYENLSSSSKSKEIESELNLLKAKKNYNDIKNERIIETMETYYDLLCISSQLSLLEQKVKYYQKRMDNVEAEVERGYKNSSDLFSSENELQNIIIELRNVESDYEHKLTVFKANLGIPSEEDIKLFEFGMELVEEPLDWDYVLEEGLENSYLLKILGQEIELTDLRIKRAKAAGVADNKLEILEYDRRIANKRYKNARNNLVNTLKQQYRYYQKQLDNIELREKMMIDLTNKLKNVQKQYYTGYITKNKLKSAELSLLESKGNYQRAIYDHLLSELRLKNHMGKKLGVDDNAGEK